MHRPHPRKQDSSKLAARKLQSPMMRGIYLLLAMLTASVPLFAQREPVLKQIDLPHPYYFREMYLPQLTSGTSAAAWTADGNEIVYSMAGTLWRQKIDSSEADQLTAGAGYDYQPDCSPDGRWAIYSSYAHDAMELWAVDLQSRQQRQLTNGGAVNVEPRFSPDGKRVAFVSTSHNGHFHIFMGDFRDGNLSNVQRLTGETRSDLPRYYYSAFDHEISPAWSRDGSEIVFVSNRNHIHGTGGFWRMNAKPGAEAREIHYEETAWKARPDFSPDGKRLVYSSYLGRQWHQLWLIPSQGGDAFPISYGDFDNTNARWSPDGTHMAFISNRGGNTSLWTQEIPGGTQTELVAKKRNYLSPVGTLTIHVQDEAGHASAARIFVTGADKRAYAPDDAWMYADDNFVRAERPFEAHYFQTSGESQLTLPAGVFEIEAMKGFEHKFEHQSVKIPAGQHAEVTIRLQPLKIPQDANARWISGDVHVHMNYGGTYRNTPQHLVTQAAAEDLSIVEDLIVNKEQRVPDLAYFTPEPDAASTASTLLLHSQEYHTSYWGHLGLLSLTGNIILPGYAGYPNTASASLFPANTNVADLAHQQNALVGYVHPYDSVPDPAAKASLNHALPVDLALGKVDYIEVVGFSDHKSTAEVWYRLLNCGFRLPTASGTDAMQNYASLRGPVGMNRAYVKVPKGPLKIPPWLSGLKAGRTFATNGPLLGLRLDGKEIGDTLELPASEHHVKVGAWMRSIVPIDHLQLICNGKVAREWQLNAEGDSADVEDTVSISQTGWCVLRAFSDKAEYPILDLYPYATTSPIYVNVDGSKHNRKEDAHYFMAWIDRMVNDAKSNMDWNNEAEKSDVLGHLA
ncbi:MAG: CehA/McbA family metallohydrolase, partial [Acidobacteriota bacterium]|nr:CehA/McbA family metallohydrolase [Acidobacteriota bacterium]